MRDILYHLTWVGMLPLTFFSAHLGVLLWIWVALLPPVDLLYGTFGTTLPFNKLAAGSVFLVLMTRPAVKKFYFDGFIAIVFSYAIVVTLSYLFSPYSIAADVQYDKFWKEIVLAVLITGLMYTRHRLHQVALVLSIAFGFQMAKEGLIFLLTAGGHKVAGSAVTGDNNGLALAILMTIPFMLFVAKNTALRLVRLGIYITAGLGAVTVIATYSRGGFVGLIALGLMLLKGSRYKVRTLIAVAILGAILFTLMPSDYLDRVNTIKNAGEDDSFVVRLVAWKINFLMAVDNPILGNGLYASLNVNNWFGHLVAASTFLFPTPLIPRTYVAHSIYFQVLGDTGFVGFFLFMLMLVAALLRTMSTQRAARKTPGVAWAGDLARASQISLVLYMICGAALSLVYYEGLYILLAVISRTHRTVLEATATQRLRAPAATPEPRLLPAYRRAV